MKNTLILLVVDGFGIGRKDFTNPVEKVHPKNINFIKSHFLSGSLQASGIAVGLPFGEEGNSEVGHLTLGCGRIPAQHFPKINLAIKNGDFFKNKTLLCATNHVRKNKSALNLAGLLTEGNVHASLEHIEAILKMAKDERVEKVNFHLFTDGKDSEPKSAIKLIDKIEGLIKKYELGKIASISGRYYALDRDDHYERTEKTYRAMTGQIAPELNFREKIKKHYERELPDEYIEPMLIGPDQNFVKANDALIFFDFREDSIRQLAGSFILKNFEKFPTISLNNLYITTMTNYSEKFLIDPIFQNEIIDNTLGKVLSDAGKVQLRIAETEKYAHVTYFFDGYRDKPFDGEYKVLIPSKRVLKVDDAPEMMTSEISLRIMESISEGGFDFILANFANPDIMAHTGNFEAGVKAVEVIDEEIGKIMDMVLKNNAMLIITSDHGHVEEMLNSYTGERETKHVSNLVPFYLVGEKFRRLKEKEEISTIEDQALGFLSDVAPTILELMGIPKPKEMMGMSILKILQ
ncbi:MAG: 2,3-bisphosphoglycerate-independent phosphoglycerate mutase [Candidatus Pacebacteria bacterium]|nr:2,3-bisphosphoglycerate-independent phosphoglycerate mutase [Candidatus Paceibacterota bacterium]